MDYGFVIREEFLLLLSIRPAHPSNPSHTFYHSDTQSKSADTGMHQSPDRREEDFKSHIKSVQNDKKLGQVSPPLLPDVSVWSPR